MDETDRKPLTAAIHPLPDRLADFGLGKLDEGESMEIADHLSACESCQTLVDSVREDSLAKLFRRANARTTLDADPGSVIPPEPPTGYELLDVIGEGGMGLVYRARQIGLGRIVALKQIRPEFLAGREALDRFRREAEAVARLRHPNIVPIYDVGRRDGAPYYSMEYVDGGTLGERLAGGPLPPKVAARLIESLALAVQHAHDSGVIHRDLKPANILLAPDLDCPKIGDFGLAKQDTDTSQTRSGMLLGTPSYMSPEQASGDMSRVGPSSDIYSLGAILYEAMIGRPPLQASTVLETLELVRTSEPPRLRTIRRDVPRDLETIALKCLEKTPDRRYLSARFLADDLHRYLQGEPIAARAVSSPERLAKWARRRPWQALSVGLGVLVLIGSLLGTLAHNARLREEVRRTEKEAEEAKKQRGRAENQYRSARNAIRQMVGRFAEPRFADPSSRGGLGFRRQIVEDALAFYERAISDDDPIDTSARLDKIQALLEAGYYQFMIDRPAEARTTYQRTINLINILECESPTTPEISRVRIESLSKLGAAFAAEGRLDEAAASQKQAILLAEQARQEQPASVDLGENLAWCLNHLGTTLLAVARSGEAEPYFSRSTEIRRNLLASHPEEKEIRRGLAGSLVNLALIHGANGKVDQAESEYAEAADSLNPMVRDHHDRATIALSLAKLHLNWGSLDIHIGKLDLAIERFKAGRGAIDIALRSLPDWPEAKQVSSQLSAAQAYALSILGRHREAIPLWREAIPIAQETHRTNYRLGLAASIAHEGDAAEALAEADVICRESRTIPDIDVYNLACVAAIASGSAGAMGGRDLAESAAARSLRWLEEARNRGIFRDPRMINSLKTDGDFQALWPRADFQLFLRDLSFPADPFQTAR